MLTRTRSVVFAACGLALMGVVALTPRVADACGGCFIPPGPPTVVSGHRMVMSISQTQTVLWDQIQYSGEPEEFAWVLPVKPGARIEAGTAAFFEVLEAQSAVRVQPPFVNCGGGSASGCGFASGASADEFGDGGDGAPNAGGNPVEVVHQGTVGPYDTVTLSTDEPGALNDWLESNGYNVDDSTQPIVDAYVAEGFDFIALRLQPGQGVQQMTPVRVVMEGGTVTLPLRMVGIGTGAQTPIVLYVIGEGRYTTQNFEEVRVSPELVSWDFESEESNYTELRDLALAKNDGKSFLTAFSTAGFFTNSSIFDPVTGTVSDTFQLYADQALQNGEISSACSVVPASFQGRVKNPCPPGEPSTSPACGTVEPGEIDARSLGCPGADDIAVALEGMHIENAWVTRLEANLPRHALESELTLQASMDQQNVSNVVAASIALNPEAFCGSGVIPRTIDVDNIRPDRFATFMGVAFAGLGAALMLRRSRQRFARR